MQRHAPLRRTGFGKRGSRAISPASPAQREKVHNAASIVSGREGCDPAHLWPVYNFSHEAEEELGMPGRMLSGGKQAPEGQDVYWNACIFDEAGEQIWHGDVNLTKERDKLQALADRVGVLYLTPEQPFRFKGFKVGLAERGDRVVKFEPASGENR